MGSDERRLLAILNGDVVGFSRLMAADQEGTIRRLAAHRDTIGITVVANHGRLVDFTGDNFLAEFGSAVHAMRCAVEIQHSIHVRDADTPSERRMNFRLGAHVGDVRIEGQLIFGDPVNIAARLQSLSEIGGVCLSRQILDQVVGQLDLDCEDLSEQVFKNIPYPVHAFSIAAQALITRPAMLHNDDRGGNRHTSPAHGIPTIAVLPFINLSADPEQEPLIDAITVDVITGLSCDPRLSTIAYNSVRQFKGNIPDINEFGSLLGVRYVVEGAVRLIGSRLRVSIALIDVDTRRQLWGDKIDRAANEIFAVFDELVEAILTALSSSLNMAEVERFRRKPPEQLDAWALATRAIATRGWMSLDESLSLAQRGDRNRPAIRLRLGNVGVFDCFQVPHGFKS